ncbi:MAG: D-alanyl-D-alanine carboxypeptidase family protein, partial [Oscillospiraceae bacterium]
MKKQLKIFSLILTIILTLGMLPVSAAPPRATARYELPFEMNVASCILVSLDTGEVIFEKNADVQRPPASLTKLMTSYLVFKYVDDIDGTMVTAKPYIYDEFYGLGVSTADIRKGETLSMRDLLYAMLLPSGNEAASMVADYIGNGSISNFNMLMTTEAKKLGCKNTNFNNPHGLFSENHYSSAYDMYLIAKACYETPGFMEIASTRIYELPANVKHAQPYNIISTIRMMDKASPVYRSYVKGMKTGSLPEAGHNFVTLCEKNGEKYILVLMGVEPTDVDGTQLSDRPSFDMTIKIMDYFFDSYTLKAANSMSTPSAEVKLKYAKETDTLMLYPKTEVYSVLPKDVDESSFQKTYELPETVSAPVAAGDVIGTVSYFIAGSLVGTTDLVCETAYERDSFIFMVEKIKEAFTSLY